ncbi:MAG: toll/interleukin-1 receptor domain-containing protein [Cyanobacteria bacterium P01_F01_bin.143]
MNLTELTKNGLLNQLVASFRQSDMAEMLLDRINFPVYLRPRFPTRGNTLGYWQGICQQIQNGVLSTGNDLQPLIDEAAEIYQGNPIFQKYKSNSLNFNTTNNPSSQHSFHPQNKLQVFLCHSSDDKPTVRELSQKLKNDGFQPWLDEENILPGQNWELEIEKAIESTDIILVCLSQSSVTKVGYVQKEIKFALDIADRQPEGSIFVIPVKLQECQIPRRLSKKQWVDLYTDVVKGYGRLVNALEHKANELELKQ